MGSENMASAPPFQALADLVRAHAGDRPAQLALREGGRSLSYGELDALMDRVAAALQRDGAAPGDAIAICAATSIEYVVAFLGALRAGVAVAPLAPGSTPAQLAAMVADAGARQVFLDATTDLRLVRHLGKPNMGEDQPLVRELNDRAIGMPVAGLEHQFVVLLHQPVLPGKLQH